MTSSALGPSSMFATRRPADRRILTQSRRSCKCVRPRRHNRTSTPIHHDGVNSAFYVKVFWFFFSKKKVFLPSLSMRPLHLSEPTDRAKTCNDHGEMAQIAHFHIHQDFDKLLVPVDDLQIADAAVLA